MNDAAELIPDLRGVLHANMPSPADHGYMVPAGSRHATRDKHATLRGAPAAVIRRKPPFWQTDAVRGTFWQAWASPDEADPAAATPANDDKQYRKYGLLCSNMKSRAVGTRFAASPGRMTISIVSYKK